MYVVGPTPTDFTRFGPWIKDKRTKKRPNKFYQDKGGADQVG
jgi:hypothetical protein